MRQTTKELVKLTLVLVVLFLILTHFTGFSRSISAGARGWSEVIRTFQGRG